MIQASMRITAPAGKREGILQVLQSLKSCTESLPGCRRCRILRDVEDRNALTYIEHRDTPSDFENHVRSEGYRRLLAAVETTGRPPEVEFCTVSETQGIEYLVAVLGPGMC